MIDRIRRLPSPALAISAIALVVAVGGGTFAIASSSNAKTKRIVTVVVKKLAPTLSVKHAKTAGTATNATNAASAVIAQGVADGVITTPKIADGAVTSAKLNLPDVSGGLNLQHAFDERSIGSPPFTLFSKGLWTLTGNCHDDGSGNSHATITISTSQPAVLSINGAAGERFASAASGPLAATISNSVTEVAGADFSAHAVAFLNYLNGSVIAAVDHDGGDAGTPFCLFSFDGSGQ